jgi:hypothetical protein
MDVRKRDFTSVEECGEKVCKQKQLILSNWNEAYSLFSSSIQM